MIIKMKTKTIERKRISFFIFLIGILMLLSFSYVRGVGDDVGGGIGVQITVIDNPNDPVPESSGNSDHNINSNSNKDDSSNHKDSDSKRDDSNVVYTTDKSTGNSGDNLQKSERVVRETNGGKIELDLEEDVRTTKNQKVGILILLALNSTLLLMLIFLLTLASSKFTNQE